MQTERLFLGPKTSADQQKHMFIKSWKYNKTLT